jgi:AraC-like DNA-binding protein
VYQHRHLFLRLTVLVDARPSASLKALAKDLRVHPHTLAAIVHREAGEPYARWLAARRLALARRLLASRPDLAVKEIAGLAGFGSASAFSRFLRRRTGLTPTAFRARAALPDAGVPRVNELARESSDRGIARGAAGATLDSSGSGS